MYVCVCMCVCQVGDTALIDAAKHGNMRLIKTLLAHGAVVVHKNKVIIIIITIIIIIIIIIIC